LLLANPEKAAENYHEMPAHAAFISGIDGFWLRG
jgi:hypothetical protein